MSEEQTAKSPYGSILIKNIYYMLTYAFKVLENKEYRRVAAEPFERIYDLYAEILYLGVSYLIKQGLYREYVSKAESMPSFKGKLDLNGTICNRIQHRHEVFCEYDELTESNIFNRIIISALNLLLRNKDVETSRKDKLKKIILLLPHIEEIDLRSVHWNTLRFQRNNQTYEMIINICYLIYEGLLLKKEEGTRKNQLFDDKQISALYERFVLEFYRKEFHGRLDEVGAPYIKWAINEEEEYSDLKFLPRMESDIVLKKGGRTLIIDTKCYGRVLRARHEVGKVHNQNLYQIFTYVLNEDKDGSGAVSGMLLYAKTAEKVSPDMSFYIKNNHFMVKTLDLNTDFESIKKQLESIAYNEFPELRQTVS